MSVKKKSDREGGKRAWISHVLPPEERTESEAGLEIDVQQK